MKKHQKRLIINKYGRKHRKTLFPHNKPYVEVEIITSDNKQITGKINIYDNKHFGSNHFVLGSVLITKTPRRKYPIHIHHKHKYYRGSIVPELVNTMIQIGPKINPIIGTIVDVKVIRGKGTGTPGSDLPCNDES